MANKLYNYTAAAIVAGLLVSFSGTAQENPKPAAQAKTAEVATKEKEAREKEVKELRAKQQVLRDKQRELNKELLEVNRKLSGELRNNIFTYRNDSALFNSLREHGAYTINLSHDSLFKNMKSFKMDTSFVRALKENKLAMLDYSKNLNLFDKDILKFKDNIHIYSDKLGNYNSDSFHGSKLDKNYKGIEKSKTISRSYPVNSKDKLSVNNQYGTVTINTWNKNEIKVDVEVKAYDSSDEGAQQLLDAVKVEDSKTADLVSFKTVIERAKNSSWWSRTINGKTERHGVQVNYVVYMPAKSSLDVSNTYGAVILPDLDGALKAKIDYGSLKSGKLSNSSNTIKTSYSAVAIESIEAGSLSVQYGKADIGTANNVNMDLSYSNNSRIGRLINGGDLKLSYSSGFKIEQLGGQFKMVNINSTYSPRFTIHAGANDFDFDVSVNYANFNYDGNNKVTIQSKEPASTGHSYSSAKNYKGQYGKGSNSKVVIKSNYGSVQFL